MSDTSPHGISPPTPARPRRWPLVAGAVAGGLVVLAAAGLLVLDSFLTSRARREAAALSQRLGRPRKNPRPTLMSVACILKNAGTTGTWCSGSGQ